MHIPQASLLLAISLAFSLGALAATDANESFTEAEDKRSGTIVGIDLGTTYSCVGVFANGRVDIIANDQGNRITPSYVAFLESNGDRLVGDAAKYQATSNPENTIFDVKRLIGRKYSDASVQMDKNLLPYRLVSSNDDRPYVEVTHGNDGRLSKFSPEEISSMVLHKLKTDAENYLGRKINRAVVTVPAYFNDAQRHATKDAGIIAGLHVERIINEPTATAIAYGMDKTGAESNILVFDLGGGTFDVTVLQIDNGVFQVLATNGDTHLGGSDFDQQIMRYYMEQLKSKGASNNNNALLDISNNKRALQKLRKEVERVKRALSTQFKARLDIEDLVSGYDFSETLTRAKFEELNADLFKQTLGPVKRVMEDALMEIDEIDEIVLVGGSTRIPKMQTLLSEYFGGKALNTDVNPDEAVAYGAAVQGSILSGEGEYAFKDVMLLDVAPLSLGTEINGGVMTVLIKRGTTIPIEKSMEFVTIENNQAQMTIDVYEGERSMVEHNHLLGLFEMTNIPLAPPGEVAVLVTYEIDANGILEVTAEHKGTNNKKKITITPESGRLSQEDIDRMIQEADRYSEEDEKLKERVEARNELETFVYKLSSMLRDDSNEGISANGGMSVEDRRELMDAVDEAMDWLETQHETAEKADFETRYAELNTLSTPIIAKMYAAAADDDNGDDEL